MQVKGRGTWTTTKIQSRLWEKNFMDWRLDPVTSSSQIQVIFIVLKLIQCNNVYTILCYWSFLLTLFLFFFINHIN